MNAIVPQQFGAVSTRLQGVKVENDLRAGVNSGFGIIGYKGKVWSIRKGGVDTPLMREDGDGPRNSIEVVVLKSATVVSKIFYENGYVEGSTAAPDCYSTNGVSPAAGAVKKQSQACATCPMNQWGSRITPAGKQGKRCSDSKRLAVVPLNDIPNEVLGGPMLLRVPAASLNDLATFGDHMQKLGFPYFGFGMRVAFDAAEAFPKFVFTAIRPLTDAEVDLVLKLRESPAVGRVLAEDEFGGEAPATAPAAPAAASPFEQPGAPAARLQGGQPLAQQAPTTNVVPMKPMTGVASTTSAPTVAPTGAPTASPAAATAPVTATPQVDGSVATAAQPEAGATGIEDFDSKLDELLG